MTARQWLLVALLGISLTLVALIVGVTADRVILSHVVNGPPQRLAAAMGGLFAGGLIFFGGLIAGFVWRRAEGRD